MWLLATPVQFYVAARFYRSAWRGMKNRRFGMDMLVVLGTTTAYLASVACALGFGGASTSFFETSALLITFVVLGKLLETVAKGKTTEALLKLLNLQPGAIPFVVEGRGAA